MRGLGDFQRAQMREANPQVHLLFRHVRDAIDILEQLFLRPAKPAAREPPQRPELAPTMMVQKPTLSADINTSAPKLAHTIKDVSELVGVSRSAIYRAIGNQNLRALKCGSRTLILTKDLNRWSEKLPART